jgi:serine/threonine protein kinase
LGLASAVSLIHGPHRFGPRSPLRHQDSFKDEIEEVAPDMATCDHSGDCKHELPFHHGDVKADNVLVFQDDHGNMTLKLADLGLAGFKRSGITTEAYEAPICVQDSAGFGPAAADVWALGCLVLEFTIWFLGGWQLLKTFEEERLSDNSAADSCFFSSESINGNLTTKLKDSVNCVRLSPVWLPESWLRCPVVFNSASKFCANFGLDAISTSLLPSCTRILGATCISISSWTESNLTYLRWMTPGRVSPLQDKAVFRASNRHSGGCFKWHRTTDAIG